MDYISDAFKKLNKPSKQKRFLKESIDDATTYGLNWPKWLLKEVENTIYPEKVTQETVNHWINRNFLDKVADVLSEEYNIEGSENLHFPERYTTDENNLWRTNERGITEVEVRFPKGTTDKIITKYLKDSGDLEEAVERTARWIEITFNYYVDYDDSDDYDESLDESVLKEDGFDDLGTNELVPDLPDWEAAKAKGKQSINEISSWPEWAIEEASDFFNITGIPSVDEMKSWVSNKYLDRENYYGPDEPAPTAFLEVPIEERAKETDKLSQLIVNFGKDEKLVFKLIDLELREFWDKIDRANGK